MSSVGLLWTHDLVGHGAWVPTDLALPHPHDVPSVILCQLRGPPVALGVAAHLVGPELALGPVHGVLRPCSGHPCQKHPSTKTATRRDGRTKSGVQPFAICRWSLNRPPAAWTAWRSRTSGAVLTLRRPARCAPAFVLTHRSATAPTYVGGTPDSYPRKVRQ